ncbi:MAG TPA: hypothetical protein DDZ83_04530 [Nitrospinae bacterium]|nr:hypothetical protein [Nitrospinota bacterium]
MGLQAKLTGKIGWGIVFEVLRRFFAGDAGKFFARRQKGLNRVPVGLYQAVEAFGRHPLKRLKH